MTSSITATPVNAANTADAQRNVWLLVAAQLLPLIAVVLVMLGWLTLRHRRTTTSVTVTR